MKTLILGTRGSKLALWQANFVKDSLSKFDIQVDVEIIKTKGDKIQHLSFDKIEGKGFFTKELEDALLANHIDFAVHSMKDLPTSQPDGLMLAGISERADARDSLLILPSALDSEQPLKLKKNIKIGTSSIRRKRMLQDLFQNIEIVDLRGNVPTRIQKLRDGNYGAIVLAKAGLDRLEINTSDLTVFDFHPIEFVPAPAQGVLAYQCRKGDKTTMEALRHIHSAPTLDCTNIERKVLRMMNGGCHIPLGVHCKKDKMGYYHVNAAFAPDDESKLRRVRISQSTSFELAEKVYRELIAPV